VHPHNSSEAPNLETNLTQPHAKPGQAPGFLAEASADISIDACIGLSPTTSAHPNKLTLVSFFGYVKRQ
jgi:hypothetical protein